MPTFTELDPEIIRKALEGQESIFGPLLQKEEVFLKNVKCPMCGSDSHSRMVNPTNPYSEGNPLPNMILECLTCKTEFDPYTSFIRKVNDEST